MKAYFKYVPAWLFIIMNNIFGIGAFYWFGICWYLISAPVDNLGDFLALTFMGVIMPLGIIALIDLIIYAICMPINKNRPKEISSKRAWINVALGFSVPVVIALLNIFFMMT